MLEKPGPDPKSLGVHAMEGEATDWNAKRDRELRDEIQNLVMGNGRMERLNRGVKATLRNLEKPNGDLYSLKVKNKLLPPQIVETAPREEMVQEIELATFATFYRLGTSRAAKEGEAVVGTNETAGSDSARFAARACQTHLIENLLPQRLLKPTEGQTLQQAQQEITRKLRRLAKLALVIGSTDEHAPRLKDDPRQALERAYDLFNQNFSNVRRKMERVSLSGI